MWMREWEGIESILGVVESSGVMGKQKQDTFVTSRV